MTATKTETVTAATSKVFSVTDLASHYTESDAWVAIRGKVYDITKFISRHPGGRDVLLISAGKDATTVFETYHSLDEEKAKKVLSKFCIGTLSSSDVPQFQESGEMWDEMRDKVRNYFVLTKQDPKFHPSMIIRYAVVYATLFTCYYLQFFSLAVRDSSWMYLVAVVMGIACAQIGLLPMHDASHCSFTHFPKLWTVLGATHDFLNGCSFLTWMYQHILGHHPFTNISGADPDICTNEADVRRIKPDQKWYSWHRGQEYFVPLLYIVLGIKTRVQDLLILFVDKKNENIRVNPLSTSQASVVWGGKAFFVLYRFIIPLLMTPLSFGRIMALFLVADAVASYWLALLFQASHVTDNVEFYTAKDSPLPHDFATHQIITAQDYGHDSFFWTNISGALNYQIVHHLFPQISQHYYPAIAPLIRQVCTKYGVEYRVKGTYWEAMAGHLRWLRVLGLNKT